MDEVYASLQPNFRIEDDGELKKYLGMELYRRQDGSIHLRNNYLTQRIFNMIPGMDKSSAGTNPAVKPPLEKNKYINQ